MFRMPCIAILMAALAMQMVGCVTSVPGYDGPTVKVAVENNAARIAFTFPSSGWDATIDRTKVENETAMVWVTARRGALAGGQGVTRKELTFTADAEAQPFRCCEVFVKASGSSHSSDHVPAAEGCQ